MSCLNGFVVVARRILSFTNKDADAQSHEPSPYHYRIVVK